MSKVSGASTLFPASATWEERLSFVLETVRELSRHTDPQAMVQAYGARMRQVMPVDGTVSLSRRDLSHPHYRVTRSTLWGPEFNPWKQRERLPVYDRGLLGTLLYGDVPSIIDDLRLDADDPCAPFMVGHRSLMAVPLYEGGEARNMVVLLRREPAAFHNEQMPGFLWISNLFGRAAQTLVLAQEVRQAYDEVDRELKAVADIQRSLLPARLPGIPGLALAAHYQTSRRAGGDYYDFFELPDGRWGILIADVSGHGTPAAVLMAITHSIAHLVSDLSQPPSRLLGAVNGRLAAGYTFDTGSFVTAFYGVYNPASRCLRFSSAGHPPPRLRGPGGAVRSLDGPGGLPLGIEADERYEDGSVTLSDGDLLLLYTDGIAEARSASDGFFGTRRLDEVVSACAGGPEELVRDVLSAVERHGQGRPPTDDQTLLALRVGPVSS